MSPARDPITRLLFMWSGLLVWAAHFTFIYGLAALSCARHLASAEMIAGFNVLQLGIVAATILALVVTAGFMAVAWMRGAAAVRSDDGGWADTGPFFRYTTVVIGALSLVAIAWNALPALLSPLCR